MDGKCYKTLGIVECDSWKESTHILTPESPPESAQGNNKESAQGKNQESAACYSITATYNLSSFEQPLLGSQRRKCFVSEALAPPEVTASSARAEKPN